ncbi:MAG TPA: hypothetical protein VKZ18_10740 [Polyangia bacterium]|nr:hypothetical protein [Polyangia bacterium]
MKKFEFSWREKVFDVGLPVTLGKDPSAQDRVPETSEEKSEPPPTLKAEPVRAAPFWAPPARAPARGIYGMFGAAMQGTSSQVMLG